MLPPGTPLHPQSPLKMLKVQTVKMAMNFLTSLCWETAVCGTNREHLRPVSSGQNGILMEKKKEGKVHLGGAAHSPDLVAPPGLLPLLLEKDAGAGVGGWRSLSAAQLGHLVLLPGGHMDPRAPPAGCSACEDPPRYREQRSRAASLPRAHPRSAPTGGNPPAPAAPPGLHGVGCPTVSPAASPTWLSGAKMTVVFDWGYL